MPARAWSSPYLHATPMPFASVRIMPHPKLMTACWNPPAAVWVLVFLWVGCAGGRRTAFVVERPATTEQADEVSQPDDARGPVPKQSGDVPGSTPGPFDPVPTRPDRAPEPSDHAVDPPLDVQIGPFDTGKMWTFDNPPVDYFEETYGFRPDSAWFARARLGALRLPNCSASFVSSSGLILTNHHCARESISEVAREDEDLLYDGFHARSIGEERKVEGFHADQLIEIEDVTDEVIGTVEGAENRYEGRRRRAEEIETRMEEAAKGRDSLLIVQVVELYEGERYSAYTLRRYEDIRLVFAPELSIGAFGGDPDNFTYPRYSLDFSFFRAYGADGEPLQTPHYFAWDEDGVREGEAVFVVGNPGTTSRLATVSQLLFERDYSLPGSLDALRTRMRILEEFMADHPEETRQHDLRNTYHQISNQFKKHEGELEGLRDPRLIARRELAESDIAREVAAVDSLQSAYGRAFQEIDRLQRSKEAFADQESAFAFFGSPAFDSHVLVRSLYGYVLSLMRQRGASPEAIEALREEAVGIEDWPAELEKRMLAARLREMHHYLGDNDPTTNRILRGMSPEDIADRIIAGTVLTDSAKYVDLLEEGFLSSQDPSVSLSQAVAPLYFSIQQQASGLEDRERALNADLVRARFALRGMDVPPDATFSLRIADGIVSGYPYNGTMAPYATTLFGMYDHYHSYGGEGSEWDMPERWRDLPDSLDLATPVNLVTTNDITGGNSGSPLLDKDLRLVGVVFDSNIDALRNTYIYLDERGRSVSVDARGILEVLDEVYEADRIVQELTG